MSTYTSPLYWVKDTGIIIDVRKIILLTQVEKKDRDAFSKFLGLTPSGDKDDYDAQVMFTALVEGRDEPLLFGLKVHKKPDPEKKQLSAEEAETYVRGWYGELLEMWEHFASRGL